MYLVVFMLKSWDVLTLNPKLDVETKKAERVCKECIQLLYRAQLILGQNTSGKFNHFGTDHEDRET